MDLDEDTRSFSQVLQDFSEPENRRDPRALRLAAVAAAMIDLAGGEADCTAAKVYAKTVTALEGALAPQDKVVDSIQTQVALLQILSCTVRYVTPPAILQATFPLASRVIRAVVAAAQEISADVSMETKDGLGGVFSLLKHAAIFSGELLKYIPSTTDTKLIKHFLQGTLLTLFNDPRPKVWKAANSSLCELMISQSNQVVVKMLSSHAHSHLAKAASNPKTEVIESMQQLVNFLEHSILYMNYEQLGADLMKLLVALMEVKDSSATDFVTVTKVRDATPRVLVIGSLLSVVGNMLEDDSEERKVFLDEFASRIIATQLQLHPKLVLRQGVADAELVEHCKIQYGQTLLIAIGRLMALNSSVVCKLLPITIQMLVLLSCPSEIGGDDSAVGEALLVGLTQLFRTHLVSFIISSRHADMEKCLRDTLRFMDRVMEPSYIDTYGVGLKSLAVLIKILYSSIPVAGSFVQMVKLRNAVPPGSPARRSVEDACGIVVQEMGIELSWKMLDLDSDSGLNGKFSQAISIIIVPIMLKVHSLTELSVENAWLLSTFKSAANASQPVQPNIAFFQSNILVMARKFDKLAASSKSGTSTHRQRVIDLWSLFPCFCRFPEDVEATIVPLSSTLVRVLQDRRYPELLVSINSRSYRNTELHGPKIVCCSPLFAMEVRFSQREKPIGVKKLAPRHQGKRLSN
jgi:ribosomal RNA-processing protein 12